MCSTYLEKTKTVNIFIFVLQYIIIYKRTHNTSHKKNSHKIKSNNSLPIGSDRLVIRTKENGGFPAQKERRNNWTGRYCFV